MTDCIDYPGCVDRDGYGKVCRRIAGKAKFFRAHRLAWEQTHGPIPDGLLVLHGCDNPRCVNPDHLRLGSHQDNHNDAVARDRQARELRLPFTKLSDDDVRDIISARQHGESAVSIAERYQLSVNHARQIALHGRRRITPSTKEPMSNEQ